MTDTSRVPAGGDDDAAPTGNAFTYQKGSIEEIAGIERVLKERRHEYDSDAKMQGRYLALLRARESGQEAPAKVDEKDVRAELPPAVVEAWSEGGDASFRVNHERAMTALAHIGSGLADETAARDFAASVNGLGEKVHTAMLLTLGQGPVNFAKPAGEADVAAFRKLSPNTAAIVDAWGESARHKIGQIQARWKRLTAGLDDADRRAVDYWIDHRLDAKTFAALAWSLAGQ